MLKKALRITHPKDFDRINTHGTQKGNSHIIIKYIKNDLEFSRFGFIISNRISKKAVVRNKIKRQLREIIRLNYDKLPVNYDIVIYSKGKILELDYSTLEKSVLSLLKKIY